MPLNIRTEILIHKSREEVWKIFSNFKAYPDWNPFLTRIVHLNDKRLEVDFGRGEFKLTMQPDLLVNTPKQEFRWKGKLAGVNWLFVGEHFFILHEKDGGKLFEQGEDFKGFLVWLLWSLIGKSTKQNFIKMNEALKALVEK